MAEIMIEQIDLSIQKNQENVSALQNEYKELLNIKFKETVDILKQADIQTSNYINNIQKEAEIEKENNQNALAALKSEFTSILELQQQKHNEEVIYLQNQMLKMQAELREEMKSPLKKFMEKYRNNSKKDISNCSDKKEINSSGGG